MTEGMLANRLGHSTKKEVPTSDLVWEHRAQVFLDDTDESCPGNQRPETPEIKNKVQGSSQCGVYKKIKNQMVL